MDDLHFQSRAHRPWHRRAFWFWVSLATVVALVLRVYNLEAPGFWIDEIWTVHVSAELAITHHSKVFGYLPTWLGLWLGGVNMAELPYDDPSVWQSMGVTHAAARAGSVAVGILTVPLVAWASRRMLGSGGAVMLALLLAASPWHIYWSQASRFYSLQFLFYTLALAFYFTATRDRSRGMFGAAMLCVVLAFLSQPTALAILGIFGADWLLAHARGRALRIGAFGWLTGIGAVGLCGAILLGDVYRAPEDWSQFVSFGGAEYQPPHKLGMGAVYMLGPAVAVAALGAAAAFRRRRERLVLFLLLSALLPIAIFAAWSIGNFVGLRYLMISLFGWLALAAIGLDRIATVLHRRGQGMVVSLAPLGVLIASAGHLMLGYYTNAYGFHPRWPEAYAYVERHARDGDVVACRHPMVGSYYLQRRDIAHLPRDESELGALGDRVWLVVESESTVESDIGPWIFERAELKRSLDISIPRPISRVKVLLYTRAPDHPHIADPEPRP